MSKLLPSEFNLRLSVAEWILVQLAFDPKASSAFAQHINPNFSHEELRGALIAARDCLMARDMAKRSADSGKLILNPALEMLWLSAARPSSSLVMTIHDSSQQPRLIFFNTIAEYHIGNWIEEERLITFELVSSSKAISTRLFHHWYNSAALNSSNTTPDATYVIPSSVMPKDLNQRVKATEIFTANLMNAGVPQFDADDLANCYTTTSRRASLFFLNGENPAIKINSMIWLQSRLKNWVILEGLEKSEIRIEKADAERLSMLIEKFVADSYRSLYQ